MNASKEQAQNAYAILMNPVRAGDIVQFKEEQLEPVRAFLMAALRKLPTEAAYAREKNRKRIVSR